MYRNKGLKCVNIPCSIVLFFFWGWGGGVGGECDSTINGNHNAVGPVVFIALEIACVPLCCPFLKYVFLFLEIV